MPCPKLELTARVLPDGPTVCVNGREAETLQALIAHGSRGVSALSFPGGPAYRLAAYVCDLRGFGIPIDKVWAEHDGGRHGVYFLTGKVEIISPTRKAAA